MSQCRGFAPCRQAGATFLERVTGVREPNVSDWRRKSFGDLMSTFRFGRPAAKPPVLPDTGAMLHLANYAGANLPAPAIPGADQQAPVQEQGTRKRVT